jgi:hypothetical protein
MEHLPADRVPDAPCFLPIEASVGHGYIAETGDDAITLTLLTPEHGPINVVMDPRLAVVIAEGLTVVCERVRQLSTPGPEQEDK